MFGPVGHKTLIADSERTNAYRKAILKIVKKDNIVVDLGAGTGILAFFACQAGAKKIYAIEKDKIIELAKEIARANNLEGKIVFIRDVSTEVTLPEKADVLVSELIGNFVYTENLIHFILDGRDRFLKKNGILIPSSVDIFIAPVQVPQVYGKMSFWNKKLYGIDFRPAHKIDVNTLHSCRIKKGSFLSGPARVKHIDFGKVRKKEELFLDRKVTFVVERSGILHGIAGWFDIHLAKNVVLSTSPDSKTTHWEQSFFPVERPVKVTRGDSIEVRMAASPWQGDIVHRWEVKAGKNSFAHSTFHALFLSGENLLSRSIDSAPSLSVAGEEEFFILSHFGGKKTIKQIARELQEQYPKTYKNLKEALNRVGRTVRTYGKIQNI